ncbi:MAG TPA: LytTR family DNA-binding domain-containing protein, partial [Longimicrobiales bacterium]|nr:LytTR family DNA-binding domain-containing protein [Longimicrobiales bacterium]
MPALVFVTAHDAHALRAFEVQALDYLLKPFTPDRFRSVLARVRRLAVPAEERAPRLAAVLREVAPPAPYLRRILVHAGGRARLVPVEEIRRVEAVRNDVRLHTASGEYLLSGSISALEARLDPAEFLRINRSEIVRLDAIREMHPWSHGDYRVVLHDGTTLSWSRRYRARAEGAFSV